VVPKVTTIEPRKELEETGAETAFLMNGLSTADE
jgi:hypothetical protein